MLVSSPLAEKDKCQLLQFHSEAEQRHGFPASEHELVMVEKRAERGDIQVDASVRQGDACGRRIDHDDVFAVAVGAAL